MISRRTLCTLALSPIAALAQPQLQARPFLLGLLTQADDERYSAQALLKAYTEVPGGRSEAAAQIALNDSAFALEGAGWRSAKLLPVEAPNAAGLPAALQQLLQQGVQHILLELPAAGVAAVAAAARGKDVLLFNTAAPEDILRGSQCAT